MSEIDDILGADGLLSRAMDRYEYRDQQIEMAQAIQDAFDRRTPLIVEAATGTGKTLAYLVPAVLSGKRVVVSTGTKALQEQLFLKDIPFLAQHWSEDFEACVLKGRKNYLCKLRFAQMKGGPHFRSREEARMWPRILSWASETETGDRAEIEGLPDDFATWNDISVGSEACVGTKCEFYEDCWVTRARRAATTADVIVVNHHLFFADLALRAEGFGEILPDYDAVIFDEAHHLESVATSHFGYSVSNWRFREIVGDVRREMEAEEYEDDDVEDALLDLDRAAKDFYTNLTFNLYDGRYELSEILTESKWSMTEDSYRTVCDALLDLERACKTLPFEDVATRLSERCGEIRRDLQTILQSEDARYVYFLEMRERGYFLEAAPIDLASLLRRRLLDKHDTMIFTSATLATGGTFEFFKQRMGMMAVEGEEALAEDYPIDELILPSTFDYAEQTLLYVPDRLPEPKSDDFVDKAAIVVDYLLGITEGRAFVLFTSYGNMNAVHDIVAPELDHAVFRQGEAPKSEILDAFRDDVHSVLFATASFWEGVDVEGEALSLVIIDKLPFANPSDPLTAARTALIEARGGNSFTEYSLPSAALSLKQGFGRLIRSREDVGVVAILDSRIARRRYGPYFLETLPPAPIVWRAAGVRDWWADHGR